MKKKIILDTDMYNEIDDRFALVYLMNSIESFDLEAITIAPFSGSGYADTKTIEEGTNKSYDTTIELLTLLNKNEYKNKVYKGATEYSFNSQSENPATNKIIEIALKNEKTTILAIGAPTNIALAIEKCKEIEKKIEVIWLGGNSFLSKDNNELNFRQDIKSVKTLFNSNVELVVIPCRNVASNLTTTIYELSNYLNKNTKLNKYLLEIFKSCKKNYYKNEKDGYGSSKTLWDLSVIAYLINKNWFEEKVFSAPEILLDGTYKITKNKRQITFVTDLYRNKIYRDFFIKLENFNKEEEFI